MKRVAASVHLPTARLFERAKRPDDKADYCLDGSFFPQWKNRVLVFTLEWSAAHPIAPYRLHIESIYVRKLSTTTKIKV